MTYNHAEYMKEWRKKNKEKIREYHLKYGRKWRPENKQIIQKQRMKHLFGSWEMWRDAMLKYEGECAFACDRKAEMVHHINGKSRRNSSKDEVNNELSNLLPLCKSCHGWLHMRRI